MEPIHFGVDAPDEDVAVLHLGYEALEWLACSLPQNDGLAKECFRVLDEIDQRQKPSRGRPDARRQDV